MFDFVGKHKTLIQIVLFVIFLPFAFFGIDSYFRQDGGGQAVARVGDHAISQDEFSRALRERQDAIQRMVQGQRLDPAMLDNAELRFSVLEGLIQRKLLLDAALRSGMTVSDEQLRSIIVEQQAFRDETGKFSYARYEQYLKSEGRLPATFEASLRQDLILQQFTDGYVGSGFAPRTAVERLAKLSAQQREVSQHIIAAERFTSQVKLEADSAKKYYDANVAEFRIPEQVRVEYVTLAVDALMQQVQVEPAEVRKAYEGGRSQYEVKETRQAGHIFFSVDAGAGAEAKQQAQARAAEIHKQLQKAPASFAELAKKHSEDPGSAAKGGDLGTIGRGAMKDVPEFEDALFKLKPGAISPPVASKLGIHIIRLTALQPAKIKPFEEVRVQIEQDLRKQLAGKRFAELADNFNNVVYEQSESLKPAADLLMSRPRASNWISRTGVATEPLLNNSRLLSAIFSDDVLRNKRNSEVIEVAPGTLVAARLLEHKPESLRPFDEVRAGLDKLLVSRAAARLAVQEGQRLLSELKEGKGGKVAWSAPQLASRSDLKGLPEPVLRQAFRADASRLPAYAGLENPQGGYVLVRVSRVVDSESISPQRAAEIAAGLRQVQGQEAMASLMVELRRKGGVTVNKEYLGKKEDTAPPPAPTQSDQPASRRRGGL
jgi:peptidyl-prolyl cis-trans isomerase D